MKEKNQRRISGNNGPEKNLSWFIDETAALEWNLGDRKEEEKERNQMEEGGEIMNKVYVAFIADVAANLPMLPKHIYEKVEDPTTYTERDAFVGKNCF